jgi:dTDP-glucose pyrophosphorylase
MKALVLPTASVTRLYPFTKGVTNHPLPIYPTPIVYEPINVLMLAGESR